MSIIPTTTRPPRLRCGWPSSLDVPRLKAERVCCGLQHMHDLPHVHLPAAKLPKSPNMSTSPLSTASVVPLYDGSWPALRRPDQPSPSVRQLFQQPDGARCLSHHACQNNYQSMLLYTQSLAEPSTLAQKTAP